MVRNTNDGTDAAPRLRCYFNMGTLGDLPPHATFPGGEGAAFYEAIRDAGFEGVQGGDHEHRRAVGLGLAIDGRINAVGEADELARRGLDCGAEAATVHVLWGLEDDDEVDAVIDDILNTSAKRDLPIYVETHRATCTDDMWRTVKLAGRHPDLRFNGDFSHWYTGHEMVYGGFERKLEFIAPVLERVRFMHGRIGSPGNMQVDIGPAGRGFGGQPFVDHFRAMWTASMAGFLRSARPGDYLVFAPELLAPDIYYARAFRNDDGAYVEEGDRWQQSLLYCRIAQECFDAARATV